MVHNKTMSSLYKLQVYSNHIIIIRINTITFTMCKFYTQLYFAYNARIILIRLILKCANVSHTSALHSQRFFGVALSRLATYTRIKIHYVLYSTAIHSLQTFILPTIKYFLTSSNRAYSSRAQEFILQGNIQEYKGHTSKHSLLLKKYIIQNQKNISSVFNNRYRQVMHPCLVERLKTSYI